MLACIFDVFLSGINVLLCRIRTEYTYIVSAFLSGTSRKPSHPDGFSIISIIGLFTLLPRRRVILVAPPPKCWAGAQKCTHASRLFRFYLDRLKPISTGSQGRVENFLNRLRIFSTGSQRLRRILPSTKCPHGINILSSLATLELAYRYQ